ncbi:MAG: MFS transporter [Anaerolineaceae bacterium]|nr:MFS transporter [Anaerolineaceae bacterium]
MKDSEKLTVWQKIGYGLGDIYGGGSGTLVSFYYLYFLTDVVRISPGLAGVVILISKIYDSVTDPFEGMLADRTRTKLGRRRPYLLAGIPLVFLSFFALFYPINYSAESSRFWYVIFSYLFFSTVVSIVMLNYNALHSELTLDYNERTSLSSIRILFSTVASIVAALVPLEIVKGFADVRQGYITMGLAFGLFFALPYIATVAATRERKEFQKPPEKFNFKNDFFIPFKNKTFIRALMMYLFAFVAIDTVSSIIIYFMKYFLNRGSEANYVSGTLLVVQVISLPLFVYLSKKFSKQRAFMIGAVIWTVMMAISLLIQPAQPNAIVYIFAAIVGIGTGGVVVCMYAIFPDIPDVDELHSGQRREGIFSAMITFMRKLSSAFAIFLVSQAIQIAGYISPVQTVVDGVTKLIEQPQPDSFILVLRMMFAFVPIVLVGLAAIFAKQYPLTPEKHQQLNNLLAVLRKDQPLTPEQQAERQLLKEELVG